MRLMYLQNRAVFLGNYLYGYNNQGWRMHEAQSDVWIEGNYSVGTPGSNQPLYDFYSPSSQEEEINWMRRFRIRNNQFWATQSDFNASSVYRFGFPPRPNLVYDDWQIENNIWHDPTGPEVAGTWGGVLITNPYTRTGDIRIGPEHPSYLASPPAVTNFGAIR